MVHGVLDKRASHPPTWVTLVDFRITSEIAMMYMACKIKSPNKPVWTSDESLEKFVNVEM